MRHLQSLQPFTNFLKFTPPCMQMVKFSQNKGSMETDFRLQPSSQSHKYHPNKRTLSYNRVTVSQFISIFLTFVLFASSKCLAPSGQMSLCQEKGKNVYLGLIPCSLSMSILLWENHRGLREIGGKTTKEDRLVTFLVWIPGSKKWSLTQPAFFIP